MIWVIGDIHGMFDPLKRLMAAARGYRRSQELYLSSIYFGS